MRPVVSAFLILALAACNRSESAASPPKSWCHRELFESSGFTVCDNQRGALELFAAGRDETPLRSFADVARKVDPSKVAFAMNAGMFDENGHPIGLVVRAGEQLHAINLREGGGNFHLMPNGVFLVRDGGTAEVVESKDYKAAPNVRFATQSGPMLVIDGKLNAKFDDDGESRNIRNGVGVTSQGRPLFVISEDPVSFGKFARFFRDRLHTPSALYFDGAVSSLWDPPDNRQDAQSELGPMIVAFKPAASAPGREGRARP